MSITLSDGWFYNGFFIDSVVGLAEIFFLNQIIFARVLV